MRKLILFNNEPFAWFPSYQESFDDIYIDYEEEDYEDNDSEYDNDDLDVGYA